MRSLNFVQQALCSAPLALAVLAYAPTAGAQECESNSDCAAGYICQTYDYGCAEPGVPPTGDVGGSEDGGAPDGGTRDGEADAAEECEPQSFSFCELEMVECAADSDCAEGLKCITNTYESCTGSDCACPDSPDGEPVECDCEKPEPPECETVTESYCGPKWAGECTADADCGEGFKCVEGESCGCSGSSGTGDSDGGTTTDPQPRDEREPDGDCSCEPTGVFYCELIETACEADSDCPSGFSCMTNDVPVDGGTTGSGGGDDPTAICAEGAEDCIDTPDVEEGSEGAASAMAPLAEEGAARMCVPSGWYGPGMPGSAEDGDFGGRDDDEVTNDGSGGGTGGDDDSAASDDDDDAAPVAADDDDDDDAAAEAGADDDDDSTDTASDDDDADAEDDGCNATSSNGTGMGMALMGLALMLAVRRRRAAR